MRRTVKASTTQEFEHQDYDKRFRTGTTASKQQDKVGRIRTTMTELGQEWHHMENDQNI